MNLVKKYLITLSAGALAVLLIIVSKDIFVQTEVVKIYHILCDAFFAVGAVMTGIGLLIYTTNEGVFDGLVYAVGSFIAVLKKEGKRKYETLYDYKVAHAEKKISFGFVLICGLFYLLISIVMYLLYRNFK